MRAVVSTGSIVRWPVALGWLAIMIVLVRIVTDGTFSATAIRMTPGSRAVLNLVGLVVAGLSPVLAGIVVLLPKRRSFVASCVVAVATVLLAFGLAAMRHDSAMLLGVVAVAVANLSALGWRGGNGSGPDAEQAGETRERTQDGVRDPSRPP